MKKNIAGRPARAGKPGRPQKHIRGTGPSKPAGQRQPAAARPAPEVRPGPEAPGAAPRPEPLPQPLPGQPVIAVVGGGAAGLCAALCAAGRAPGARVLVLERAARVGRKLLATGNGRCNLSNTSVTAENYVTGSPAALGELLARRPEADPQAFFALLGLLLSAEEGRVYPWCGQAAMVLDVLRAALAHAGVPELCGRAVTRIERGPAGFELWVENGPGAECLRADRVVLAAGGAAAPQLGGCRDGFVLAQKLGHGCTTLEPGLTGLRCRPLPEGTAENLLPGLKGLRVQAAVSLEAAGRQLFCDEGEVQFGETGLSGIPVLQASLRLPQPQLPSAPQPQLVLDLLPQLSPGELLDLLRGRRGAGGPLEELLLGTVPKKLGWALMKCAGLGLQGPSAACSDAALTRLAALLKGWRFAVTDTQGWEGAQTTRGGVPLDEIDPATCESRRCGGLYLAGELLDAAGECGGFNLDWAFSTGLRAGSAAAQSL